MGQKAFGTCRVNALVCFVTKKLVKLTKYAKQELNNSNQTIVKSFFASWIVMPTTLSSIKIVAGSKKITAIGAMYNNRFIELSFSLQDIRTEKHSASTQMQSSKWIQGNVYRVVNTYKREDKVTKLPLRRQKNSLQYCLQRPCCSCSYAHYEAKQMKARLAL